MTERTSSACARAVTHGFMQREVTDGTEERVIRMNDGHDSRLQNFFIFICNDGHDSHFQKVGVVRISVGKATGQRCRPFVCTFCVFERGIKHPIVIFYMRS